MIARACALVVAVAACSSARDRGAVDASRCAAVAMPPDAAPRPPAPPPDAAPPSGDGSRFVRDLHFTGAYAIGSGSWYDRTDHRGGVVVAQPEIRLRLDYPLSHDAVTTVRAPSERGFTLEDLCEAIRAFYQRIYAEEDRDGSTHPYGIWGHHISDLFIESLGLYEVDGVLEVSPGMGS